MINQHFQKNEKNKVHNYGRKTPQKPAREIDTEKVSEIFEDVKVLVDVFVFIVYKN